MDTVAQLAAGSARFGVSEQLQPLFMALFCRTEQEQNPLAVPVCCTEDAIIECASLSWQRNVITSPSTEEGPALAKSPLIQLASERTKTLRLPIDREVRSHPERFFSKSSLLQCFLQRDEEMRGRTVNAAACLRCPDRGFLLLCRKRRE